MSLHIGAGLILPETTVTSKIVILGSPGQGKSNLACVLCEELHSQGHKFCYIDPTGAAYGLKYSADGKGAGLSILIFGGEHGDIPIDPQSGRAVADLIADENVSAVIDLSRYKDRRMWKTIDQVIFVRDYCEQLYLRQGERRRPMMLLIDEATRFAPETVRKGDDPNESKNPYAACKERIEEIQEQARILGIGSTLISQRDARLAKSVSEVADCLFSFRTIGPRSVGAVMEWIKDNIDDKEKLAAIRKELRSLPRGSAIIASPGWLEMDGIFRIRHRATFDSSATPVAGKTNIVTGPGAILDLAKFQAKMSMVVERVKADDPAELRREIADLRGRLAEKVPAGVSPVEIERIRFDARETVRREIEAAYAPLCDAAKGIAGLIPRIDPEYRAEGILFTTMPVRPSNIFEDGTIQRITKRRDPHDPLRHQPTCNSNLVSGKDCNCIGPPVGKESLPTQSGITGGTRKVLVALAQRPQGLTVEQIGVRAGLAQRTVYNLLTDIRRNGWVTDGPVMSMTAAGLGALGRFDFLPTGKALLDYWCNELSSGHAQVLREIWPKKTTTVAEISGRTGLAERTVYNILTKLRSLQLVCGSRGSLKASEELY